MSNDTQHLHRPSPVPSTTLEAETSHWNRLHGKIESCALHSLPQRLNRSSLWPASSVRRECAYGLYARLHHRCLNHGGRDPLHTDTSHTQRLAVGARRHRESESQESGRLLGVDSESHNRHARGHWCVNEDGSLSSERITAESGEVHVHTRYRIAQLQLNLRHNGTGGENNNNLDVAHSLWSDPGRRRLQGVIPWWEQHRLNRRGVGGGRDREEHAGPWIDGELVCCDLVTPRLDCPIIDGQNSLSAEGAVDVSKVPLVLSQSTLSCEPLHLVQEDLYPFLYRRAADAKLVSS
mmetsp:Transcript_62388/g.135531  ORF Transcript_62388/g.135531 Transcript_62388/m.135531 type:complete len:293 (-) Transcript_62388:200-1078(-)